jgi:hypothetical protein
MVHIDATVVFGVHYNYYDISEELFEHCDENYEGELFELCQDYNVKNEADDRNLVPYFYYMPIEMRDGSEEGSILIGIGIENVTSSKMMAILLKEYEIKQAVREFAEKYNMKPKDDIRVISIAQEVY